MHPLLELILSNTAVAGGLAVLASASSLLKRPAVTHVLWLLVIVKLLTPPAATFPVFRGAPDPVIPQAAESASALPADRRTEIAATPVSLESHLAEVQPDLRADASPPLPSASSRQPDAVAAANSSVPGLRLHVPLLPTLLTLWACGSLLLLALIITRVRRFCGLLRHAAAADGRFVDRVDRLRSRLGLRHRPQVLLLPGRLSPMLWWLGVPPRARLLFPRELLATLSDAQLDTLLAHELAHLKRRDHLVRLVELLALIVLWWHPLLHVARRQLHHAEELACDAEVLWGLNDAAAREGASDYAAALVNALGFISPAETSAPPAATGLGHLAYLKRRLTMILNDARPPRRVPAVPRLALAGLLLTLPLTPTLTAQDTGSLGPRAGDPASGQKAGDPAGAAADPSAARALIEACLDPEPEVRMAAFNALSVTAADAAPALIDALKESKQRHIAIAAAQSIGWPLVPALIKALDSPDAALRAASAEAISQLLQPDKAYFLPGERDPDPSPAGEGEAAPRGGAPANGSGAGGPARGFGGGGSGHGGSGGRGGLGSVDKSGFYDTAGMPSGFAAPGFRGAPGGNPAGFGGFHHAHTPEHQQQAKDLAKRLAKAVTDDNDFTVRRHAAAALAKLPGQQEIAGPAMLRAAADRDPRVRKIALASLNATASPADAVTILAKALADPEADAETRQIALMALTGLGREAKPAIPALITALKDKDPQVRRIAADAIGAIQSAPMPGAGHGDAHDPNTPVHPGTGAPAGRPGK